MPKAALWRSWLNRTLLQDIHSEDTADPVPFFEGTIEGIETSSALSRYKWGLNDGDYCYLIYQIDSPCTEASDVTPIYIGESNDISQRIGHHSRKIRNALPTSDWKDDGEWGSFSKYDHIATVYERTTQPLYVWIVAVDELEQGPYGYETYRQELEAKLVGIIHAHNRYHRRFANREFVPNRIVHELGHAGPDWITDQQAHPTVTLGESASHGGDSFQQLATKADCWNEWLTEYLIADINDGEQADPIPLFETTADLEVKQEDDILKRSAAIDTEIRREGKRCVDEGGVLEDGCDGLLYIMYQLTDPVAAVTAQSVVPRYIGKAEAHGKKRELSSNFTEIAHDRNATNSFARWGDGNYWHIGELSRAYNGADERKRHWVQALFEPASRTLSEQTYLWVHAWNQENDSSPYRTRATLAEVEPLLIGTAYDAYPRLLLNKQGTPDDSPVTNHESTPERFTH